MNTSILYWVILMPLVFLVPPQSSAQSPAQKYFSVQSKFSKTIFVEPMYALEENRKVYYYVPAAFGLGTEVAYSIRKSNFEWGGNLGLTNLAFNADRLVLYDYIDDWPKSTSAIFLKLQAIGKRYIPIGKFETNVYAGIGGNYYLVNAFRRPLHAPKEWGVEALIGTSVIFPVSDRLSITLGSRFTYQVNKFFESNTRYVELVGLENTERNNSVLHFLIGTKFLLGNKDQEINTGRFPVGSQN